MATQEPPLPVELGGEDDVYVRSPLTAAEEAVQFLPGSRFLNTREFKRVYLGAGATASSSRGAEHAHALRASPPADTWPGHSHDPTYAPRRPPAHAAPAPLRRGRGRGAARRLRHLYGGGAEAALRAPPTPPPAPAVSAGDEAAWRLDPSPSAAVDLPGATGAFRDAHTRLPRQLRARVRSARPTASPASPAHVLSSSSAVCTEDAWLALRRELEDKKREAHGLQQQLRRAHVVIRTLHGVPEDAVADAADAGATEAATPPAAEPAAAADAAAEGKPAEQPRPREYWQRRAYFLERQNEELQAEAEQLRGDTRTSKVRALLHELEVARAELDRLRRNESGTKATRPPGAAASAAVTHEAAMQSCGGGGGDGGGDASAPREDGVAVVGSVRPRLLSGRSAVPFSLATAVDEAFLRQKDDAIRELQERLRLLSQQYQRADAELMAVTRQLEDTTHRHTTLQAEWKALSRLPQELARTQQQLTAAQSRLLDADREVEAFHQVFDTLESPATLRAVVEERDHLVELLRQRQQSEAALRDEMKAAQEEALQAAAKRLEERHGEALAMAHDREAQQEGVAQALRKSVAALERQLEAQRDAYEAQLAEQAQAHEAEVTERLLESVRHPPVGVASAATSVSALTSAAASPRPTSPDGGPLRPQQSAGALLPGLAESPLSKTLASASVSRRSHETDSVASSARRMSNSASAPRRDEDEDDATAAAAPDAVSSTLSSVTDSREASAASEGEGEEAVAAASLSSSASVPGSRKPSRDGAPASHDVDVAVRQEWVTDSGSDSGVDSGSGSGSSGGSASDDAGTGSTLSSVASSAMENAAKNSAAHRGGGAPGSHATTDDETLEKDSGPSTDSSLAYAAQPSPTRAAANARGKGTASLPHSFVMDLPPAPVAVAPPTSILINRNLGSTPLFSRHLHAVVHSPATSTAPTESATDLTQTHPTLTSTSDDPKSGSDDHGEEGSYSESASGSRDSSSSGASAPHGGAVAPAETTAARAPPSAAASAADEGAALEATQMSSIYSGDGLATRSPMAPALGLPRVEEAAPTPPPSPPPASAAATASLRGGATPPSPGMPPHPASAKSPPTLSPRGVPIPSPPAVTAVVASNMYPVRASSSFMLFGGASEDEFGRGGAGSRPTTADHNASFDLTPQFSGNASFDFVGPLAERHRLEEMQNISGASSQQPSPRSVGAAAGAPAFPSVAPPGGSAPLGWPGMGTGAAGLRRTPSPPLGPPAVHPSSAVPALAGDGASLGSPNASLLEVSVHGGGGDDDDTASSISAERVTAGTRERQEPPPRGGRLVYAGTTASGEIAFTTPRGEPVTASLAPLPPRPATTTASSTASSLKRSPIPGELRPEDNTFMSVPLDASGAGSAAERPIPAAAFPPPPPAVSVPSPPPPPPSTPAVPPPPAASVPFPPPPPAASVPAPPLPAFGASLAPLPPTVAVPAPPPPPPSSGPPSSSPPAGLAPLPPRVEVPQPPAGQ